MLSSLDMQARTDEHCEVYPESLFEDTSSYHCTNGVIAERLLWHKGLWMCYKNIKLLH
jgi:hypothetical protein